MHPLICPYSIFDGYGVMMCGEILTQSVHKDGADRGVLLVLGLGVTCGMRGAIVATNKSANTARLSEQECTRGGYRGPGKQQQQQQQGWQ
jgi:hypothetical protein